MEDILYALEHDDLEMFEQEAPRGFFIPPPADMRPEILRSSPTIVGYAAYYGASEILLHLVDMGFSVNSCDAENRDAIHFAAARGKNGIVSMMLSSEMGSNQDSHLRTPLHYASESGCLDTIKLLLEDPIATHTINSKDAEGNIPLHLSSSISVTKKLIEFNSSIHARNSAGETALYKALYNGSVEISKYLLELEPSLLKIRSSDGSTVLHAAAHGGKKCVMFILKQNKSLINSRDNLNQTPLHYAAIENDIGSVVTLAKLIDINSVDVNGATPLHFACGCGNSAIAKYIIQKGADPLLTDNHGRNSLHYAAEGDSQCVSLLFVLNLIDPNAKTERGSTAAHIAAENGFSDSLELLFLKSGMTINEVDGQGRTPIAIASACGFGKCVQVCINAGSNINLPDKRGLYPLDNALLRHTKNSDDIVSFLDKYDDKSIPSSPVVLSDNIAGPIASAGGILSPRISKFVRPRKRICLSQTAMSDDSSPLHSQPSLTQNISF